MSWTDIYRLNTRGQLLPPVDEAFCVFTEQSLKRLFKLSDGQFPTSQ